MSGKEMCLCDWYMKCPNCLKPRVPAARLADDCAYLEAENKRLKEALVTLAIPHEALLADAESRRWIAPCVWTAIEDGVRAARAVVAPEASDE